MDKVTEMTPRPVRRALLAQSWLDLAFLHWPADPEQVERYLPEGTSPDLFDDHAYVGLVPFRMWGVGPATGLGIPYLGSFPETNIRLYTVDEQGRRGVVFRSLEAARLLPALVGRVLLRMPYMWSSMRLRRDGDIVHYASRRRWPGPRGTRSRLTLRVAERIDEPSALEHFLTARWGMHVPWYGRTIYVPNEHRQWPLHRAELVQRDDELLSAAGFPSPGPPCSVLWSPGVSVRFGTT